MGNGVKECDAWVSKLHPIVLLSATWPISCAAACGIRWASFSIFSHSTHHVNAHNHFPTPPYSQWVKKAGFGLPTTLRRSVMALSIEKELRGSMLLTGGVGFLGSVCLLQTIQLPQVHAYGMPLSAQSKEPCTPSCSTPTSCLLLQVKRVYVLVRGKKGLTAQQRVQKLLCGPLFHELHKQVSMCTRGARNPAHCEVVAVGMTRAARCCLHAFASHRLQKVRPTCSARSRWWRETSSSPTWASPQQTSRPCCQTWRPSFTALPA